MKKKTFYPVLLAFKRNEEGMLSAWCPFCVRWHHHGAGDGHRVAHCYNNESPFRDTGYILKAGKPPSVKKTSRVRKVRQ